MRLRLYFARLFFILHVCVDCVCLFAFVCLVCLFALVSLSCDWSNMRLPLYVARFRFVLHVYVDCMRVLFMCAFFELVCA